MKTIKKTLAVGPEISNMPSWNWVGKDTAKELSKYYNVITFRSLEKIPNCDFLMLVKHPLKKINIQTIKSKGTKVLYCPIDFYHNENQLKEDLNFLSKCDAIALHCERWIPFFEKINNNVYFVEHHSKFSLQEINSYKKDGFVLWIGSFQYVPFLLDYIKKNTINYELRICSDLKNERAKNGAEKLCRELRLSMQISEDHNTINGIKSHVWSEEVQKELMEQAKAAIDVKSVTHFSQCHKPPTKAQKYVSSGIPFAINKESYSYEYFMKRGLILAEPFETDKLFSHEYWLETSEFSKKLKPQISIINVGLKYKDIYENTKK